MRVEEYKWRNECDRLTERLKTSEACGRAVEDQKMLWKGKYNEKVQELKRVVDDKTEEARDVEERKRLARKLEVAKDKVLAWQGQTKDWMYREKKERQRKDHVAFLLDEAYGTINELKKVLRLEDELAKGKKNGDDKKRIEEDEEKPLGKLRSREDIMNEVVELDDDDLMDRAVMRDIDEKCSTPEDVLLNTPDSVLLAAS